MKKSNYKNNAILRKKVKRMNDDQDQEDYAKELNLVRKLKCGKISIEDFNE